MRSGENSKGFITVAKPTERRPFFLSASWTFVTLDPGEVLWDVGAQEGVVGKQQLDKWCELFAEHSKSNGARRRQNPQVESEALRNQSVLCMCQLVWLGAMVSSDSLLWSRMSHLCYPWDNEDTPS